jgi:hypothetical protein
VPVAGAFVFASLHPDGHLQVSNQVEDSTDWLQRTNGTVRLRVTVGPYDVYTG